MERTRTPQAGLSPQPRHKTRLDPLEAVAAVQDILEVWHRVSQWPDAQPISGGVWDAWPARLADGLAICRDEAAAVRSYLVHESEAQHG